MVKKRPVDVYLTSDIEFDVNGAFTFPDSFDPLGTASVFRVSDGNGEGIDRLLAPLREHGLPATYFVETLQCHYFGLGPMKQIVDVIRSHRESDIQMHIHPAWQYCKDPGWRKKIKNIRKNDSLLHREPDDADAVVRDGIMYFEQMVGRRPAAIRTGSLIVDREALRCFARAGIGVSSSVGLGVYVPDETDLQLANGLSRVESVLELPVSSVRTWDPRGGRWRLLSVIGTPFSIMQKVLETASELAAGPVVFLTHASEFSSIRELSMTPQFVPNVIARKRWDKLCRYLACNRDRYALRSLGELAVEDSPRLCAPSQKLANVGLPLLFHRFRERVFCV